MNRPSKWEQRTFATNANVWPPSPWDTDKAARSRGRRKRRANSPAAATRLPASGPPRRQRSPSRALADVARQCNNNDNE